MDSLRLLVGIIASTSIKGRDDFKSVYEKEMIFFNAINQQNNGTGVFG